VGGSYVEVEDRGDDRIPRGKKGEPRLERVHNSTIPEKLVLGVFKKKKKLQKKKKARKLVLCSKVGTVGNRKHEM